MFFIFVFAVSCIITAAFVQDIESVDKSDLLIKFLDYTLSFENRFYDYRVKSQIDKNYRSKEIVLLKIDDYSLQKIGQWPIPRTNYAKLLDKLAVYGSKVVALDVLFPEKSPMINGMSPDKAFAESMRRFQEQGRRVFLAYTIASPGEESLEEVPVEMFNDALQTRAVAEKEPFPSKIAKFTFPIPEFVQTEAGLGNITSLDDQDGVFRQYTLIANVDTVYFGSLAYNAFEAWSGTKNTFTISDDSTGELSIGDRKLEISRSGRTKIRYVGWYPQFPEISMYDVLAAKDDDAAMKEFFHNKIVFVGSTATGAHDLRQSPIDSKMPGVYSHLNMTHMLIHKYFFQNINDSVKISLLYLCIGMLIFVVVVRFGNAFIDAAALAVIIGASYYLDKEYFFPRGYELKLFYCYFCFGASYSWHTFIEFYRASKEKKQIKGTFARYVAPTVVDEMLKDPDNIQVGGTKMDITCLFSDVRDFTSISEGLSATELAHSLNLYMGKMTDIVFDTRGTLDKYIGDAIVALWGAPLPIGNHAQFAVEGAIKMMEVLPEINAEFEKLGRPIFKVGIGLNSGECSVGNMGSSRIFSYTALGDNMNLGARLESLCKHYGAQILISEFTLARLDLTNIKIRPIDKVIVKGKTLPVAIYEVLHLHHPMTKNPGLHTLFLMAHELFMQKHFAEAIAAFDQILAIDETDKPSKRIRDLCTKYLDHPELVKEDFDVTKMTEK